MFDEEYIKSLIKDTDDNKIKYINDKIKRKGVLFLSISEYNYLRQLNSLSEIKINNLRNILYESMISYSDIEKNTGISRTMMCMILRGNRNCTINQLNKIMNYLSSVNDKIKYEDLI